MNSKLITLSCLFVLVTGCGQKDRTYYEANLDDARIKAEECDKDMISAIKAADKTTIQKIADDSECKFAGEINSVQKSKIAKYKRDIEREKIEAE